MYIHQALTKLVLSEETAHERLVVAHPLYIEAVHAYGELLKVRPHHVCSCFVI